MKKLFAILLILSASFGFKAKADEGMWLLPLIEKLNMGKMTELGLKLSAEDIYSLNKASLKDAVVIFGGDAQVKLSLHKDSFLQTTIAVMAQSRNIAHWIMIICEMGSGQRQKKRSCQTLTYQLHS